MALRLNTNEPLETRLLALTGAPAVSNFGADQLKFRTTSGDLYVSEAVGAILEKAIAEQRIDTADRVTITKREVALGNGRKTIRWELLRVPDVGEQPDGTFALPAAPVHTSPGLHHAPPAAAKMPPASASNPSATPAPRAAWAETLLAQTNALTDVYAAALAHASAAHGNAVKAETVQSLLVTVFINLSKGTSSRAA